MTAKKAARPLTKPAQPAIRRAARLNGPITFARTTAPMPRLQVVARPEAEPGVDPAPDTGDAAQRSDKDLILRLVEVLKSL